MKQSTKRLASFVFGLALIFLALLVFSNFIRPAYSDAQKVKAELLSKENFLANQKAAVDQVKNLINSYRGEGDFAQVVDLALPNKKNEAELVHQINQLAEMNQLGVQTIAVSAPGLQNISQGAQVAKAKSLTKPVGSLNVQVRVAGSYANFRAFLSNLETNIRIINLRNISVTPVAKSNQDFYLFDISVVAYYQNP